ncbi:MAG: 3-deoxy-8-phosphooctulonate synthase [Bdellovibrionales bacterium]|nr:3-deoxy-8-phosphooctulonate synthase [Bdellovibrionales bacterium]
MTSRLEIIERLRSHAKAVAATPQLSSLPAQPFLFCGPCQLESRDHALRLAEQIKSTAIEHGFLPIFKASFDKANRTKSSSARGVGLEQAKPIFTAIQQDLDIPTLSDIHLPEHPKQLEDVVDVLQIPAFLCRQTDLLIAAGESGKVINLKKGQFVHPTDLKYAAEKIAAANSQSSVYLCERGACFGYRDLVVDMRGLFQMRELGYPVVFDGSHVVQSMSGKDGVSGGNPIFTPPLCRAAVAVGIDALFIETHENPSSAPSDGDSMLPLTKLSPLLKTLRALHSTVREALSGEGEQ